MAGRSRIVRCKQSYINASDAHSGLSMLKAGTPNKIGNTQWTWYPLKTQCAQGPLDFLDSQAYYNTLQWQTYGNLWPPFRPSPRISKYSYYGPKLT
jgi:hypothetical protein